MRDIVLVGGGVAAVSCIAELRARGFDGRLTLLAREPELPYDRPHLSKGYLHGDGPLGLEPTAFFARHAVELRLGVAAESVDLATRRVRTSAGHEQRFDRLVVCSGGRAALPDALAAPGVLTLRDLADARELRDRLRGCERLAIVGGGFIGGEIAAAAVRLGSHVVMFERDAAPLAAVLGEPVGRLVADLHREHGVDVRAGQRITRIERKSAGAVLHVDGGPAFAADEVVVGVGMAPEVAFLTSSGVGLDGGVRTDAYGRTSAPGVMAAGDCARWWNPRYGQALRVEHWEVARRHGLVVAASLLGAPEPFAPVPYFWSDQYDVKYQWVGHASPDARVELELVDPPRRFVARYVEGDRVVAAFAAGEPGSIAALRRELEGDAVPVASSSAAGPVAVDQPMCIGSGNCVRIARGAFELDSSGIAQVADPAGATRSALELAARSCPTGAISLSD